MITRWRVRRENEKLLRCPVCDGCFWTLYGVSLARHRSHFLKSRMVGIEGPWGTCKTCGNHFSLGLQQPRLLDRAGGLPVEVAGLLAAQRAHHDEQERRKQLAASDRWHELHSRAAEGQE